MEPESDELYEVEDLLECKEIPLSEDNDPSGATGRFFLVKWRGFDDPTWEPDANLGDDLAARKAAVFDQYIRGVNAGGTESGLVPGGGGASTIISEEQGGKRGEDGKNLFSILNWAFKLL